MSYTEWQMFDSSSIAAGRYDGDSSVLEIQFNEGKIYRYVDVPRDIWLSLCRDDSKDDFFLCQIHEKFSHENKNSIKEPEPQKINYTENTEKREWSPPRYNRVKFTVETKEDREKSLSQKAPSKSGCSIFTWIIVSIWIIASLFTIKGMITGHY